MAFWWFVVLLITPNLQPSVSLSTNSFRHRSRIPHYGSSYPGRRHALCINNDGGHSSCHIPWGPSLRSGVSLPDGDIRSSSKCLNSQPNNCNNHRDGDITHQTHHDKHHDRRSFLERSALLSAISVGAFGSSADTANARGLARFPCKDPLSNTYHFLRAGSSLLEVEDIWSTNPLFLTNREAALSELGEEQVTEACRYLKSTGIQPTVVRYSLAAASIDSANIVGEELNIGRDRLVPEFNYMDPRAIGAWDFAALNATEEAVWALDADEAGQYGKGGKPPPNEDGTPSETLADQVVRLTNLLSVLETLYSGDTVLLVFPDGTGPALLSCLMGGIPLNRVHELQFRPGEIRCDVDFNSINALASRPPSPTYLDIIQRGRVELKQLRDNPDLLRNVKDLKFEEERELERKELEPERKKLDAKRKEEDKEKELEMQRKREERLQLQNDAKELEAKRKEEAKEKELKRRRQREERNNASENSIDTSSIGIIAAVVGGAAVALGALFGVDESEEIVSGGQNATDSDTGNQTLLNSTTSGVDSEANTTLIDDDPPEKESDGQIQQSEVDDDDSL
ncbi:hypothetical protein ACHAXR_006298, partial [Thalassiosira sp. AJA248-18]